MTTVSQILSNKPTEVHSVSLTMSVFEALQILSDKNVGAVIVLDNDVIVGVFSERDYARKVELKGKASKETALKEIMSTTIHTVKPTDTVDFCMGLMSNKRIRHLPVVNDEKILGVISIGDLVKAVIENQKETIQHLDAYINGTQI
jgi:CBS domain-containing protein